MMMMMMMMMRLHSTVGRTTHQCLLNPNETKPLVENALKLYCRVSMIFITSICDNNKCQVYMGK